MIDIDIELQRGDFQLDVTLASSTAALALFGPSGSGKTSILMALAGLLRPARGHITLGQQTVFDSARDINLPPRKRGLGVVFQDLRLFPHLSVRDNLLYARAAQGFDATVSMLGLGSLLARKPDSLSGGEARRVAMGRALLAQPTALLLDEPLTGLHRAARDEVLHYLRKLKTELQLPLLLVSHQDDEVMALADAVALIADGRIVEQIDIAEFTARHQRRNALM
ncbi:MAG: ATP-binding cassette domain-containing protein [Xanthomonadales bacterium]|nr:ATP-binding cassette domain-containing protein [Xanthomonadales bacterium]